MTLGRRKSTNQKLRVKAKKSPGQMPWRRNDDGKKKDRQGQQSAKERRDKGEEVQCRLILESFPGGVNQALLHLGSVCGMR